MSDDFKKHLLYITLSVVVLIQVFLILFNGNSFAGGYNIANFQAAHYGVSHFFQLSDYAESPLFKIALSPFALLGYDVAKAFNIIAVVLTLVLIAKFSKKLAAGFSNDVVVLAAFAPVYFFLATTCYPEIFFGLILMIAFLFFSKKKFILSAIILSLIPLVQSNGLILLPVFAFAYLLQRKTKAFLVVIFSFITYLVLSLIVSGNLFGAFRHDLPPALAFSKDTAPVTFLTNFLNFGIGLPMIVLSVIGFGYWAFQVFNSSSENNKDRSMFILIGGSGVFLVLNGLIYEANTANLSDFSYWGTVVPVAALLSVKGLQFISNNIKSASATMSVIWLFLIIQVFSLFAINDLPLKSNPAALLDRKAAKYIQQVDFSGKVFCTDPEIIFQLGINPFDESKCFSGIVDSVQPSKSMNWGDIFVWNKNLAPNNEVLLKNLEKDSFLKKIESFRTHIGDSSLADEEYFIQVYKKTVDKNDSIVISNRFLKVMEFGDMESPQLITEGDTKVWNLDSSQEYSPTIILSSDMVKQFETIEFGVELDCKIVTPLDKNQILLVFSADEDGKNLHYEIADLGLVGTGWQKVKMDVKLPTNLLNAAKSRVYVWNKDKKQLLMRNLQVEVRSY